MTGKLQPGVRLIINELSADLGMSSGPIQEALLQLQADSLVIIEPEVGAKVIKIQADMFQEVFEILAALELMSGRAACQKMNQNDFTRLEEILRCMDNTADNPEQWSNYDRELHQFLSEKAQLPLIKTLLQRVLDYWHLLRRYYLSEIFARRIPTTQKENWDLLAALRTRSPAQVTQVIQHHNQQAWADYLAYLHKNQQISNHSLNEAIN